VRRVARREWTATIEVLVDQLETYYVDPEMARPVVDRLRRQHADGAYAEIDDDEAFADAITADTVEASGDLHLRLRYSVVSLPVLESPIVPESGRHEDEAALAGHGFRRVERLSGNVGLVEIRRFFPARISGHAAVAAMQLVADTDALVIDLRRCPGGEPDMVALVESHLFDERMPLNAIHFPAEDRTVQWWTDPFVPGKSFGGTKPVYVLLSGESYSAAEGFSYDLQQHRRATLIGEPTPTGVSYFDYRYRVSEHLMFSVPSGHVVNPVSGRSWAPDGVQPDIRVEASQALDTAYALALEHVVALGGDGFRREVLAEAGRALSKLRQRATDPPGS
jgi:Peptidase family S41/N-terminal domain of Peptidase_S41 in eukaryotic IRBP